MVSISMSQENANSTVFSPPEGTPLAPRPTFPDTPSASPPSPEPFDDQNFSTVISNGAFSKTWVLPPRKKPGRKAANDVPPTVLFLYFTSLMSRNDKLRIGRHKRRLGIGRHIGWLSWRRRMMNYVNEWKEWKPNLMSYEPRLRIYNSNKRNQKDKFKIAPDNNLRLLLQVAEEATAIPASSVKTVYV